MILNVSRRPILNTDHKGKPMQPSTTVQHIHSAIKRIQQCGENINKLDRFESANDQAHAAIELLSSAMSDVLSHLIRSIESIEAQHLAAANRTPADLGDVIAAFSRQQGRSPQTDELARWIVHHMIGKKPSDA